MTDTIDPDDYDSPWKDALTRYLPEFLAFYFPLAHAGIDWTRPHTFLDQELAQIARDAELGKRRVEFLLFNTLNHESLDDSPKATRIQAQTPCLSRSESCPITTKLAEEGNVTIKLQKIDATRDPAACQS